MFETHTPKQQAMTAQVGWSELVDADQNVPEACCPEGPLPEFKHEKEDNPLTIIPWQDESSPEPATDSDYILADNLPTEYDASASSEDSAEENTDLGMATSTPVNDGNRIASLGELELAFHNATNDFRKTIDPERPPIALERAKDIYQQRVYKALHRIPIGNRTLVIGEGEHDVRINSHSFRMLLDPQAAYSVITGEALHRAGLQKLNPTLSISTCFARPGLEYCIYVPIDTNSYPLLPGLFVITDTALMGGYNLISGKPWMIGLEKHFARYQFSRSNKPGRPWPEDLDLDTTESSPIPEITHKELKDLHALATQNCHAPEPPELGGTFARSL